MTDKQTPLYVRCPEQYAEIAGAATQGIQVFGREFLKRDFIYVPIPADFPSLRAAVVNGELDTETYKLGIQEYFEANAQHQVFSLDLVNIPLFSAQRIDGQYKDKRYLFGTSWQLHNVTGDLNAPKSGVLSNKHSAVIMSTIPAFTPYTGNDLQQAKAYLLAFHEMGHLAGEHFCNEDSCAFSHPTDRRHGLEEKAKAILETGRITVCDPCKDLMRKMGEEK